MLWSTDTTGCNYGWFAFGPLTVISTNLGAVVAITDYVNDKFIKFHQPVLLVTVYVGDCKCTGISRSWSVD